MALLPSELILFYDTFKHINMSIFKKLNYKWERPFFIIKEITFNIFIIKKLYKIKKRGIYLNYKLKHFIKNINNY
jgi:hypothetical protein